MLDDECLQSAPIMHPYQAVSPRVVYILVAGQRSAEGLAGAVTWARPRVKCFSNA